MEGVKNFASERHSIILWNSNSQSDVIIKFVNVHAGIDNYSQNIFKDRGTSHIYWETDLSQQNQVQCQWSHTTSKKYALWGQKYVHQTSLPCLRRVYCLQ